VATNQLTKTAWAALPLKFVVAVLPFSILLHYLPNHKSAALSLGLGLGVICSHLIPPRSHIRWTLVVLIIVVILGAVIPTLIGI
jgi:dolichyl-phosphate-mannose--protein O-mannosyl transferase